MAGKLTWVHSTNENDGDVWRAGQWFLHVLETGLFRVADCRKVIKDGFPTLADAKAWCESQEAAAQPAAPLPKKQSLEWEAEEATYRERVAALEAELRANSKPATHDRIIEAAKRAGWVDDIRLSEFIDRLSKERDDARAAVSRLMEALRGIEKEAGGTRVQALDMYAALSRVAAMARKAIQREEGGGK